MTYRSVYDPVLRLRRLSGAVFTLHVFRHTYATGPLRRGVLVEAVSSGTTPVTIPEASSTPDALAC